MKFINQSQRVIIVGDVVAMPDGVTVYDSPVGYDLSEYIAAGDVVEVKTRVKK